MSAAASEPVLSRPVLSDPVLIVGGDSLIGRHLAERLIAMGRDPVTTSRRPSSAPARLQLDLGVPPDPAALPPRVGVAFLLAAVTSMAACEADPSGTRRINVEHTVQLAHQLRERGAHLVTVSTNLVHADASPFARADAPLAPQNAYAAQKSELEAALLATGGASILRITKIAESLNGIVGQWAAALARGEIVKPFADLVCAPMPLAHVIEALVALGGRRDSGVFQIGADRDINYGDIARMLARRMGVDAALVQPVRSLDAGVRLAACPAHTTLDTGPTEARLGLAPVEALAALEPILAAAAASARAG